MNSTVRVKFLGKLCIYKECEKHFKAIRIKAYLYFSQQMVKSFNIPFLAIYTMEIVSRDLMILGGCVEKM